MDLLPDAQNCGLRMRRECQDRFSRHRLNSKSLVCNPGMHHGTCVTHVPRCMTGSLIRGGRENVSSISSICATCNFVYLARCPLPVYQTFLCQSAGYPSCPFERPNIKHPYTSELSGHLVNPMNTVWATPNKCHTFLYQ